MALCGLLASLRGQSHRIDRAGDGLLEAGSPAFTVLNKESLGLNSPPTDLHLLPDGRLLVVAGPQIAFGDGVRWEVFNQAPGDPVARTLSVGVDRDGSIYQAIQGGFAKVTFGADGQWRLVKVAGWPAGESTDRPVPRSVIVAGGQWFWHNNSGLITSWRPGQPARSLGRSETVAHIFAFKDSFYLSDWHLGGVRRLPGPGEPVNGPEQPILTDAFLMCSQPYRDGELMVGTTVRGLQLFDGHSLHPFPVQGVLTQGQRINSLCRIEGGIFAAAVENHGVVFFDAEGRTIEGLDHALDHRLSRVLQLIPGRNGVVWGLLDDGIFQVEFPSRVTHFEPIINSGLGTVHPNRADGRLWLIADNQLLRARYGQDGRLSGFVLDMPDNQNAFTLSDAPGVLVTGTEKGGYYRDRDGWVLFAPGSANLRILQNEPIDGQWLYCADNEIGWVRRTEHGLAVQRFPLAGSGNVYNSVTDRDGNVWLEYGTGLAGRVHPGHPGGPPPTLEIFDSSRGVPMGWVQVFVVDGETRFNIADHILRLDASGERLVPDEEFARHFTGLGTIVGRPGRDAFGRLWITTEQGVNIFTGPLSHLERVDEPMPPGFQPYYFTFESGGVVWMHSNRHLARYDPAIPVPSVQTLRALITHVSLPASGRMLYPVSGRLPQLPYADNTLIPHFLATGSSLASAVTFEVRLDGAFEKWVPAGSAGSTVLNRLAEGAYELQVRPVSRGVAGEISRLSFVIAPPWYRTLPAYAGGALLAFGLIFGAGWLFTYLERREKYRLEALVERRTGELNETNARLAAQVEEIRTLSQAIQQSPVGVLIIKPDGLAVFANPRVCELTGYTAEELLGQPFRLLHVPKPADRNLADEFDRARRRGEPWQGELTNRSKDGRTFHVRVAASPLRSPGGEIHHYLLLAEDITESLAEQERRRRLEAQLVRAQKRESLGTLAGGIAHDFNNILTGILGYCELSQLALGEGSPVKQELAAIRSAGLRAKELVNQILTFTRQGNAQLVPLEFSRPVAEALNLFRASTPATIEIVPQLERGMVLADASQIHQAVLNLCTNAAHAMRARPGRLEVRLDPVTLDTAQSGEIGGLIAGDYMRLVIADNGCGMEQAVLERIFDPFFTTKEPGEGTGLGLSIVQGIVAAHNGGLRVRSTPGAGTTFELFFPVCEGDQRDTTPALPVPQGRQQEVLVVDDEIMVTDFVAARLKRLGYVPTALHDPRAALAAMTAEPRRFAALISDLTMPHMTGVELVRRLHEHGIKPPTLIITGYNRNAARADLGSLPEGTLILQKPFTGEELAQSLHRVITGGTLPPADA